MPTLVFEHSKEVYKMSIRPTKQMLQRSFVVMIIVIVCLALISTSSLVKIMIIDGEMYQAKASEQQLYDSLITAPRGDIYDSSMNLLATSSPAWTVYLTPNGINKLDDENEAEIAVFDQGGKAGGLWLLSWNCLVHLYQFSFYEKKPYRRLFFDCLFKTMRLKGLAGKKFGGTKI